ncbi:hypothetical protein ACLB1N_10195 [Escherichia coli]
MKRKKLFKVSRLIRALAGFSGYGRVMVVGGGAEIVHPLSAKPAE